MAEGRKPQYRVADRTKVERLIAARGLRVVPRGPRAWHIVGPATDILFNDWGAVTEADLAPVRSS